MAAISTIQAWPASLQTIARDSIGSATVLATQFSGRSAQTILSAAQSAFVAAIHPTVCWLVQLSLVLVLGLHSFSCRIE
jgi:hypothetical protein